MELPILAAIAPSRPGPPSGSITGSDLILTWDAPANEGGGDVKVTSYAVQIQSKKGEWLTDEVNCDGSSTEIVETTSCRIPETTLGQAPFDIDTGSLINARVAAVNVIGQSDMSLPMVPLFASGLITFGNLTSQWNELYSRSSIEDLDTTTLTGLRYKQRDDAHELSGIQIIFSNTDLSEMFESPNSVNETSRNIQVGQYERITEVKVEVLDEQFLLGLQMIDETGQFIVNEKWDNRTGGEWKSEEIKDGQSIVGLLANTQDSPDHISWLGFLLGSAPPEEFTEVVFGDDLTWSTETITLDEAGTITTDTDFTLSEIRYTQSADTSSTLSGIQLVFTNGEATPFLGTQDSEFMEVKSMAVDEERTVRYISMLTSGTGIEGIRLLDEVGSTIVDHIWEESTSTSTDSPATDWKNAPIYEIPPG